MAKTSAEIMQMLVDNNVKFVDLRFTDFKGKEQHVSVPVSAFDEDKFEEGHAFDGSSICWMERLEASDMLLMRIRTAPVWTRSPTKIFRQ